MHAMTRVGFRPWLVLLGLGLGWALAFAGPPVASPAAAAVPEARSWMLRIQAAARERSYQGTLVFTSGGAVSSLRVGHFCVGDQTFERIEALDGRRQIIYRHNDLVHSLWPQSRIATAELRDAATAAPLLPDIEPRLLEHYEFKMLGGDRVAGREAQVLLLKPRDNLRFGQRLWADAETGLVLRADVIDAHGAVLESSVFSDIELGARPQRESIVTAMNKLDGYRVVKLESTRTRLDSEGWSIKQLPAGFQLVGCVRRPIGGPTPEAGAGASQVLQALYSDGLSRVSVFIEPFDPARPRQPLLTQMGATHTLMKPNAARWWVTVMGDVPKPTLKLFHAAIERQP